MGMMLERLGDRALGLALQPLPAPRAGAPDGLVVNTKLAKMADYPDLCKPEYKGKVAMVDDPLGNLLVWGTVVTGKPMGTLLTREELASHEADSQGRP